MAIQPVVSSRLGVNSAQLNFTGRKNKKVAQNYEIKDSASPSKFSVPLALVLAMSPLNMKSSNGIENVETKDVRIELAENSTQDVIKSQTFFDDQIFRAMNIGGKLRPVKYDLYHTINLVNKDGDKSDFEGIDIENDVKLKLNANLFDKKDLKSLSKVKEFVTYNYSIRADDGVLTPFTTVHKIVAETEGSSDMGYIDTPAACEFVEKELKSSRNNSDIKHTVRNIELRLDAKSCTLQNVPNGNILKNASPIPVSKYKYLASQDVEGDNGVYTFKYYNYTGDNSIEMITLQKPGIPEVRIAGVYQGRAKFGTNPDLAPENMYYMILLEGGNDKWYMISDYSLAITLAQAMQNGDLSSLAFELADLQQRYLNTPKGAITPVN